ncbi:hypothetical protein Tco_0871451, partial [Tanacetum coccineum]
IMNYVVAKYKKKNWKEDDSWSDSILDDIWNKFYNEPEVAKAPNAPVEQVAKKRIKSTVKLTNCILGFRAPKALDVGSSTIKRKSNLDISVFCLLNDPSMTMFGCVAGFGNEVKSRWKCSGRMDDPNITMEEYIRLEEEKAQKHGKVFNGETAKYGKICYNEDVFYLRSVETKFPAIVFNDNLTSNEIPSCEPTVISLNNELDFRISFDESDDEDYTVVFDKNLFSYKIISSNDLKMDSENYNEKVNKPLFPSPEPTVSYETSLSEYDEDEQNVLYFNDLFPFNIIYPDDLKLDKGNDNNEIDMIKSSGGMLFNLIKNLYVPFGIPFDPKRYYKDDDCARMLRRPRTECLKIYKLCIVLANFAYMALPPRDQRHQYLRYEGLQYTDADIADFKMRGRVCSLAELEGSYLILEARWCTSSFWSSSVYLAEEMQTVSFGLYWAESARWIPDKGDLSAYWTEILSMGDYLGTPPSYTLIRDPMLRLCHRLIACSIAGRSQAPEKVTMIDLFYLRGMDVGSINVPYLLARFLRLFSSGRKQWVMISGGQFVARLAEHFGLLTKERLQGLTVIVRDLPVIDIAELEGDVEGVAEEAPVAPRGGDEDEEMPQAVPPPPRIQGERISRLEGETVTSLARLMDMAGVPYTRYSESLVEYQRRTRGTFRGSSPAVFERRTRQRTRDASTSTAQQDEQQPDP